MMSRFDSYRAVDEAVGWIDRSSRSRLEISGPDAAKFLHNLTTNDIKRLPQGRGCEAFVTSPQGKTLAYISVLARPDALLVRSDPDGLALALPHLRKYGVFDDVTLVDRTEDSREYHLAGPVCEAWLASVGGTAPEADDLAFVVTRVLGRDVLCIRESPTGRSGLTLIAFGSDASELGEALRSASSGPVEIDAETFEALRIEAGTPVFGREATESNLPQEIGRDDRAINFVKGCYLGQETVARLDALGHVNRIVKGLRFEPGAPCPPPGAVLEADGKRVGVVTSSAFSPGWKSCVGLGLVRVSHSAPGTTLAWVGAEDSTSYAATVCDLPSRPPLEAVPVAPLDGL
ncbi:YgfZ/GcvT domain-containing protein [Paludisphaera borealis]|uniref:Aminomethyltransferase n=1 Tax=Paludisphaera borealis TaxID=1387353 RepID=A0A1U7CND3_9BACT|nr:glycine cleavage T C-terminal barrel domain-containing protein [Paludisphaera borealis]APW60431.1 Aminomethyltransferase [Paludisphaera borealis]